MRSSPFNFIQHISIKKLVEIMCTVYPLFVIRGLDNWICNELAEYNLGIQYVNDVHTVNKIEPVDIIFIYAPIIDDEEEFLQMKYIHLYNDKKIVLVAPNEKYDEIYTKLNLFGIIHFKPGSDIKFLVCNMKTYIDYIYNMKLVRENRIRIYENIQNKKETEETSVRRALSSLTHTLVKNSKEYAAKESQILQYVKLFIDAIIMKSSNYKMELLKKDTRVLKESAVYYDIGMIFIKNSILNKLTSLSEIEYKDVQHHVIIGDSILENLIDKYPGNEFLQTACHFIRHHHEWWNGTGYPDKLSKENIPIEGRIMAIIDAFDAMKDGQEYKNKMTDDEIFQEIKDKAGTQFDPELADIFISIKNKILDVK
jgi:response regulator receiver modulated metal dependent phosphohydrolase